jgi:MFS family permease
MSSTRSLVITHPAQVFGVTWLGQLLSLIGSGLTSFAVGIEIYKRSGSVAQFSLFSFFYLMPMALLSPIAGALIDRWDRRKVMLLSDVGAGLGTCLIWLLLTGSETGAWALEPWHFYIPVILSSACGAFRWPAFQASTTLLVPREQLARAIGLIDLASGVGQVLSPLLAGMLIASIGLKGIVLVDLVTFGFAVVSLALVRMPKPPESAAGQAGRGSLGKEIAHGWGFIQSRPGLFGMMLFLLVVNLSMGMVTVLITPLVLSFAEPATLGRVMSASGVGMLAGGIAMGVWGGPKRRIHGVLGFYMLAGLALVLTGVPTNAWLVGMAVTLFLFTIPIISASSQVIWQTKVAPDLQGRVFAVRRMISLLAAPVASLLAGGLADKFFEPWMAPGGALAGTVGKVLGTGPGRGVGFMFVTLGLVAIATSLITWQFPRIRNVEDELPDAIPPRTAPAPANVTSLPSPGEAKDESAAALPAASGDSKS